MTSKKSTRTRPSLAVIRNLREVRKLGLARKLGTIDAGLVHLLRQGGDVLEADDSYISDTSAHWQRAGMELSESETDTDYTRSLSRNVSVGKITDEAGTLLPKYKGTTFEEALPRWLTYVETYSTSPALTRINVSWAGARVAEHVDPPDQNMVQCLIEGETVFEFRGPDGTYEFELQVGDIWWFNTTWPHRTEITGEGRRLLLHTRADLQKEYLEQPETVPLRFTPSRGEKRDD